MSSSVPLLRQAASSSTLRTYSSTGLLSSFALFRRAVSSSPYGRTHVWRRRAPKLPNPVVPHFPQRVILADGSTFVHWTSSPRSSIKLTRDTTNHPLWNPTAAARSGASEDLEGEKSGRMGRFRRRFEELGGTGMEMEWLEEVQKEKTGKPPKGNDS